MKMVFDFSYSRDDYSDSCLPVHPCLKLVANCEQTLSKHTARRLLTYEKIAEDKDSTLNPEDVPSDFRQKYFHHREETRKERKIKKMELLMQNEYYARACK